VILRGTRRNPCSHSAWDHPPSTNRSPSISIYHGVWPILDPLIRSKNEVFFHVCCRGVRARPRCTGGVFFRPGLSGPYLAVDSVWLISFLWHRFETFITPFFFFRLMLCNFPSSHSFVRLLFHEHCFSSYSFFGKNAAYLPGDEIAFPHCIFWPIDAFQVTDSWFYCLSTTKAFSFAPDRTETVTRFDVL